GGTGAFKFSGLTNNAGTITVTGATTTKTVATTFSGSGIGSNVTQIILNNQYPNAATALLISGPLAVNSAGTTLVNNHTTTTSILSLTGGATGTGSLTLNNNSTVASGITASGTTINNTGTVT